MGEEVKVDFFCVFFFNLDFVLSFASVFFFVFLPTKEIWHSESNAKESLRALALLSALFLLPPSFLFLKRLLSFLLLRLRLFPASITSTFSSSRRAARPRLPRL